VATDQGAVALAEFTAAVSLAADQAAGLSLEHGLRCRLLATRLARRAGRAASYARCTTPPCCGRLAAQIPLRPGSPGCTGDRDQAR
jgi:hypothetical protein